MVRRTMKSSFCLQCLWLCASTHHSPNNQKPTAMLCIYPNSIFVCFRYCPKLPIFPKLSILINSSHTSCIVVKNV